MTRGSSLRWSQCFVFFSVLALPRRPPWFPLGRRHGPPRLHGPRRARRAVPSNWALQRVGEPGRHLTRLHGSGQCAVADPQYLRRLHAPFAPHQAPQERQQLGRRRSFVPLAAHAAFVQSRPPGQSRGLPFVHAPSGRCPLRLEPALPKKCSLFPSCRAAFPAISLCCTTPVATLSPSSDSCTRP